MKPEQKTTAPAIVIGGGINALGVVRSLGAAGVPVWVLDDNSKSPAMRSRFATPKVVSVLEGQSFIEELNLLAAQISGAAVVFLTEEKTVLTVSAMRDQLARTLKLRLPAHDCLLSLMHKEGFQVLAENLGFLVPPAVRLSGKQDLRKLTGLRFPCVFKPSEKNYAYGQKFKKAYKVESIEQVAALYEQIQPVMPDMVVQQWIEGLDSDIYFCLQYIGRDGEPVISFSGRKIRSWPPNVGGTASCTADLDFHDELSNTTADFFRAVNFFGMGSMEYKRDVRDGKFYMVEPTVGRTDFQEEVATVNGYNMPFAAYCHELNISVPSPSHMSPPRVWRDAQADRWSREEVDEGVRDTPGFEAYPVVDALRRSTDLRPWVDDVIGRARERLRLWTKPVR